MLELKACGRSHWRAVYRQSRSSCFSLEPQCKVGPEDATHSFLGPQSFFPEPLLHMLGGKLNALTDCFH